MISQPVAERELRIKARQSKTYRERTRSALVAVLIMLGMIWFKGVALPATILGKLIFDVVAIVTALYCLFEAVRHTADCLSEETREGTLGLLFLAELEAHEVVLGKLISASLASLYNLLAIFPVLGIPVFMGGVTGGEVFRLLVALLNTQFWAVAASLWVSSRSSHQIKAWLGAAAMVLGLAFGPWLLAELFTGGSASLPHWVSPFSACLLALEPNYSSAPTGFWSSLIIGHCIGWLLFALACLGVKAGWRTSRSMASSGPAFPPLRWWLEQCREVPRKLRYTPGMRRLLDASPVAWLGVRRNVQTVYVWGAVLCAGAMLVVLSRTGGIFSRSYGAWIYIFGCGLVLKTWVAFTACSALSAARRDGTLEILVSTPLTAKEIISGYFSGLRRLFLGPALGWIGIVVCSPFFAADKVNANATQVAFFSYAFAIFHALAIIDLHALCWVGLWHGFSGNKASAALGKTIFVVLVVPWLALLIPMFGVTLMVLSPAWSVFMMYRAQDRIHQRFRSVLANEPAKPAPGTRLPDDAGCVLPPPLPSAPSDPA